MATSQGYLLPIDTTNIIKKIFPLLITSEINISKVSLIAQQNQHENFSLELITQAKNVKIGIIMCKEGTAGIEMY